MPYEPSVPSVEFAMVNLGKYYTSFIEDLDRKSEGKSFSFCVTRVGADFFINPRTDIGVDIYAPERWLYLFKQSSNYQWIKEATQEIAKEKQLTFVDPFDRNWFLFKKAAQTEAGNDLFLLRDIIVARNTITSRGTYAGDPDDMCYNDDLLIVDGEHLKHETCAEFTISENIKLKLFPQPGPMSSYYKGLSGNNEIEHGENKRAKILANDNKIVWFRVAITK